MVGYPHEDEKSLQTKFKNLSANNDKNANLTVFLFQVLTLTKNNIIMTKIALPFAKLILEGIPACHKLN